MVARSSTSSASSSVSSLSSISFSDDPLKPPASFSSSLKFLCSYGGRILPRFPDGLLRYVGGDTRVLAVPRSISFSDLMEKIGDLCGWGGRVSLRCQIPTEDLDALVSVTSDEDLANLVEEYDLANRDRSSPRKIRAFLFPSPTFGSTPRGKAPAIRHVSPSPPCHRHHRPHRLRNVCGGPGPSASSHAHLPRVPLVYSGGRWQ